jgi:hypothetical protein
LQSAVVAEMVSAANYLGDVEVQRGKNLIKQLLLTNLETIPIINEDVSK